MLLASQLVLLTVTAIARTARLYPSALSMQSERRIGETRSLPSSGFPCPRHYGRHALLAANIRLIAGHRYRCTCRYRFYRRAEQKPTRVAGNKQRRCMNGEAGPRKKAAAREWLRRTTCTPDSSRPGCLSPACEEFVVNSYDTCAEPDRGA